MVKNNKNFVKKTFFITKISKTFDFFSQKSKRKNFHIFLGAFIWNHPDTNWRPVHFRYLMPEFETYLATTCKSKNVSL